MDFDLAPRDLVSRENTISLLISYTERAQVLRYVMVASYIWMLFDWYITFADEIRLIWQKKWHAGKWSAAAYLFVRWFGFILQTFDLAILFGSWTSQQICTEFFNILAVATLLLLFVVEIVLQARVYAMYRCDRRILIFNTVYFIASVAATCAIFAWQLPQFVVYIPPPPNVGCWGLLPRQTALMWAPALLYEVWLWLLVVRKAVLHAKAYATDERKAVITLLFRDSIVWFMVIIVLILWNIFSFVFVPNGYNLIGVPIFHTAVSIGGSRLVLNIREAYYSEQIIQAKPGGGPLGITYEIGALGAVETSRRYTSDDTVVDDDDPEDDLAEFQGKRSASQLGHGEIAVMELGQVLRRVPSNELARVPTRIDISVEVQVATIIE